jgi:hypothetical protein
MEFVVNEVALRQVSVQMLCFFPVNIIPQWFYMLIHHVGNEQEARWWPQFVDVVHPIVKNNNNVSQNRETVEIFNRKLIIFSWSYF